jgi:hypothetical protein
MVKACEEMMTGTPENEENEGPEYIIHPYITQSYANLIKLVFVI